MASLLELDSPRWAELTHAYGDAADIPELLRQLRDVPSSEGQSEPGFSLWQIKQASKQYGVEFVRPLPDEH